MKTFSFLAAAAILAAAAFSSIPVAAQSRAASFDDSAFNDPFLGIRASLDISCPGKWKMGDTGDYKIFGPGAGVDVGVVYNVPFAGSFFLEPGISVFYDTMDADYDTTVPGYDFPEQINAWVGTWGMRVPVTVGYRYDFTPSSSLFISTGPQLEVGFTAHLTDDMPGGSSLAGELFDSLLNRFDCQWKIGVGVGFNYNYYVGIEAAFGMANIAKPSEYVSLHRNNVSITLGYNF